MEVTKDRFELPLAVADSPWELAELRGVHVTAILHAVKAAEVSGRRSKYQKVWIEV